MLRKDYLVNDTNVSWKECDLIEILFIYRGGSMDHFPVKMWPATWRAQPLRSQPTYILKCLPS